MTPIFLDTNVVLDFILNRDEFAVDAAVIFDLAERKKLNISVSSLSINTIDYVISKLKSKVKSRQIIIKLLTLTEVASVDQSTIKKASISDFKDFEDAVQNYCAEESGHQIIVTRNTKDYKESNLSILTPKEFLASFSA